jgi:hypothetical protein
VRNLRPGQHRDPAGLAARVLRGNQCRPSGHGAPCLLLFAPFVGAALGAFAGGFASRSRGTRGRAGGGPHAPSPPAPSQPLGRIRASDADREQVLGVLKAAFAQGRLTKGVLDARVGHAFTSQTCADLAALTADIPPG